jgi:diguanylate cyclase (GGDEF)-like protein
MHGIASAIAKLTAQRDRSALDCAALELAARYAPGAALELFRLVGPVQHPRLMHAAHAADGVVHGIPKPWVTLQDLPEVESVPQYAEALRQCRSIHDDATGRHLFPLDVENHCIALVELQSETPLDESQAALIRTLLDIYRNQVLLLDYGETDSLTGLLNRKTYDATFHEAAAPASPDNCKSAGDIDRRAEAMLRWLGVIDIDFFKRVNDQHGHLIGDELLLLVARLMRATFRFGDALYRFGGEEFVILLRAPGREHAAAAFERFRASLKAYEFPQVGSITASVGFTCIRELDLPSGAFERADRAVYFAKQNGRDQVRCYEDLVDDGVMAAPERAGAVELF